MAKAQPKQHVPIFVGSTFEDLKDYRAAVHESLHQLETIVRGMEYFGSKPGSPLEECLAVVQSCKVYIGIFGMRYGSIPDSHDFSMTQLEYEEAQRIKLPSLIYLIDEENQPVLPRFVEVGEGAAKLAKLKRALRARHVVSSFTTSDDLGRKILHDLPPVLRELGTHVEGALDVDMTQESAHVLSRFRVLPKLWKGKEAVVEFTSDADFTVVSVDRCDALGLEAGATVSDHLRVTNDGDHWWSIYGENEMAERLLDIPKHASVRARASTVYGIEEDADFDHVEGEYIKKRSQVTGLVIKEVMAVVQKKQKEA